MRTRIGKVSCTTIITKANTATATRLASSLTAQSSALPANPVLTFGIASSLAAALRARSTAGSNVRPKKRQPERRPRTSISECAVSEAAKPTASPATRLEGASRDGLHCLEAREPLGSRGSSTFLKQAGGQYDRRGQAGTNGSDRGGRRPARCGGRVRRRHRGSQQKARHAHSQPCCGNGGRAGPEKRSRDSQKRSRSSQKRSRDVAYAGRYGGCHSCEGHDVRARTHGTDKRHERRNRPDRRLPNKRFPSPGETDLDVLHVHPRTVLPSALGTLDRQRG